METTTVSLIIGSLCAGLVWWSVQGFVRRIQTVKAFKRLKQHFVQALKTL